MDSTQMDRVNARVSHDVKVRAQANIEKRGFTLSEYMRIVLTMAADNGFPDDFAMPKPDVIDSIAEVVDSMNGGQPLQGGTVDDFERELNS